MRRLFNFSLALALLITLFGCSETSKEEIADVIIFSRDNVVFASTGGVASVSVASPSDWTASCSDSWVNLTPSKDALTISVASNASETARTSKVIVKNASDTKEITLAQAYSKDVAVLKVTSPETLNFDSEPDEILLGIETNGEWKANCDANWISVENDAERGLAIVKASKNEGAERTATLTFSSTKGSSTTTSDPIKVAQISKEQNPYYNLLGSYGLFAENWYLAGSPIGQSGVGTHCTIVENEYRKSFIIKDLFVTGTEVAAFYNNDGTMTIMLGEKCLEQEISDDLTRYLYLTQSNISAGTFYSGILSAKAGRAPGEDGKETDVLLIDGFKDGYTSLGITVYQNGSYATYSDVRYANGKMYLIKQ